MRSSDITFQTFTDERRIITLNQIQFLHWAGILHTQSPDVLSVSSPLFSLHVAPTVKRLTKKGGPA